MLRLLFLALQCYLLPFSIGATIPNGSPSLHSPLTSDLVTYRQIIHNITTSSHRNTTSLATTEPWPPAPFNFSSNIDPDFKLLVDSYTPSRLGLVAIGALLHISTNYIEMFQMLSPDAPAPALTLPFRPEGGYSDANVEITFYNSDDEAGESYTCFDLVVALQTMRQSILPADGSTDWRELTGTKAHYAVANLVRSSARKSWKKVAIQPRSDRLSVGTA